MSVHVRSATKSCPTLCDPMDCSPPGSFVGFSRQEDWSELPFSSPRDLHNPGIKLASPVLQTDYLSLGHLGGRSLVIIHQVNKPVSKKTSYRVYILQWIVGGCWVVSNPWRILIIKTLIEMMNSSPVNRMKKEKDRPTQAHSLEANV